jgi:DNA repair protein RadC
LFIREPVAAVIFIKAVLEYPVNSAAGFFTRNYLSGDIKPNQDNILLTRWLVEAGDVLGIQVLDYIIIGDGLQFSFKDHGMIFSG